jgi:integrase
MGYKEKSSKGEISIENHRGRIRLRWRYWGTRFQLALPYAYSSDNMHHATIKVAEIKLDILKGCFDPSLEKYKPEVVIPVAPILLEPVIPEQSIIYLNDLASKFNDWTKNIRNANIDHSIDYLGVRRVLEKYVNVPVEDIAGRISKENWCVSTYNKRLNFLSSFFSWLLDIGVIAANPLLHVNKRREKNKKKNERRIPLTEKEIFTFLEAIRQDTFCHKSSPTKHSFYYPFLKFIFHTGVRNAEAIGLRVKHVDFSLGHIEISEAFARTNKGTHHAARISKGTKTGNVRYLPLSDDLKLLLIPQIDKKAPDDFVFPSPKNLSIDDKMLQKRVFKPVLIKLGLGNRDLYVGRHCFGTRAIQQGMAVTDVAYLMGHSTIETAMRNYVSVSTPAVSLPKIKLE